MTKTVHRSGAAHIAPEGAVPITAMPVRSGPPKTATSDAWKGTADNNWQNAANWSAGVPGATNAVTLGTGTGTISYQSDTDTIFSLSSTTNGLSIDSGALTIANGATFGAALILDGGNLALNGAATLKTLVASAGTLSVAAGKTASISGATSFSGLALMGPGALATAGVTTIVDNGGGTSLNLGDAAVWRNTGTVNAAGVIAYGFYNSDNGDTSSTSIVNTGIFNLTGDDADITVQYASSGFAPLLTNSGLFAKTGGSGTSQVFAAVNNTGTINVASGTMELDGGGTLAGTLSGAGTLDLAGGSFALAGGNITGSLAVTGAGTLAVAASKTNTVTGTGTLTISGGGYITVAAKGTQNVAGSTSFNNGTLTGPGIFATSGATGIVDEGSAASLTIGNTGTWSNSGTASVAGLIAMGLYNSDNGDDSSATILNSGVFNFTTDDGAVGYQYTDADFVGLLTNTGTLGKTGGTGISHVASVVNNTGTINVASGTMELDGGGTLAGTLSGAGTLDLAGGSFALAGGNITGSLAVTGAGTLAVAASKTNTVTGTGTLTISGGGLIAVAANGTQNVAGNTSFNNGTLTGPGVFATSGATAILDGGSAASLTIGNTGTWSNSGTASVAGLIAMGLYNSDNGDDSSAAILNSGVFNFTTDDGAVGYQYTDADFVGLLTNTGTLGKTGGTGISHVASVINSTGTINVATGTVELDNGGTLAGTLAGAGTIDLGAGNFTVTGASITGHLDVSGTGTLAVAAGQTSAVTGTGTLTLDAGGMIAVGAKGVQSIAGVASFNGGTLAGPGTLTTSGATGIVDAGSAISFSIGNSGIWNNAGTASVAGAIGLGLYNNDNGDDTSASILNSGVFNLTTDDASIANQYANPDFTALFTNSGTLAKTGGTLTHLGIALNSTGVIAASTGTLELDANSSLAGSVTGAGTLALAGAVFTIGTLTGAGTVAVNAGTLVTGGKAGTIASKLVFNNGTVSGAGGLTTGGLTTLTDQGSSPSISLGDMAVWTNTGTVNDAGLVALGLYNFDNGDTSSAAIANAGVFNFTTDDGDIGLLYASTGFVGSVANSGTLAKTGGTGTSAIGVTLKSTGTITASTGTLALNGGGTLGGTIGASKTGVVLLGSGVSFAASLLTVSDNAAAPALSIADGGALSNASTLTLAGKIGLFGAAKLTNAAAGTILLTSADATVAASGTTYSFSNAGLVRDTFTGAATIFATVANTGTIDAAAGLLKLNNVTGSGHLAIEAGATLEIVGAAATAQAIAFNGAAGAMLKQDKPVSISTAIAGLGGGDRIDLAGVSATAATINGSTLSVAGGSKTYSYLGAASLAGLNTAITSDGNGGSIVSLYRQAGAHFAPATLAFGNVHVGAAETLTLNVTNTAVADGYSEALDVSLGGLPGGITGTGATGIVAQGTGALSVVLGSAAPAGTLASTGTLALSTDGTGIDGHGAAAITAQTIAITGGVYRLATASVSATTVNLGVVHVGDTPGVALTIGNTDAADGFSELLNATATASGSATVSGSISGLIAGANSTAIKLGVLTTATGTLTGSATLGLISDGGTIDGLGTTSLGSKTITVTGTVDNYAVASLEDPGGPAFTAGSAPNSFVLNLGTIALGGAGVSVTLGVQNSAAGLADLLSGSISASGSGFTNAGFGTFSGLGAGQDEHVQSVTLSAANAGTFTETVTLVGHGTNASNYIGGDQTRTLTITGTVAAMGGTYTLAQGPNSITGATGNDVFISAAGGLNSRDSLTGSAGFANSLQLTGAGVFDINAPKVFANIQTILATEGQAASGSAADTRQILLLRDATSETVLVGAGTAAAGNANAEAITIYDGNDTDTYMLAGGADTLYLGAGTDKVVLGGAANSVVAGGGTALVQGTITQAAASIVGASGSTTTLEITTGGTQTLAAADTYLTVKLDAATKLTLSGQGFVTANGGNGNDTLIAAAANQTLIGGAKDVLTGFTGGSDTFLGASAALNGDSIGNWTTGDMLDLTDMNSASLQALSYASGGSSGVLTVKDGTHTSAITFAGAGVGLANFTVLGTDGHGGTLIGWHG